VKRVENLITVFRLTAYAENYKTFNPVNFDRLHLFTIIKPMETPNGAEQYQAVTQEGKLLAALGYVPMLFFLPLLIRPRDSFCRYHGIQSVILISALTVFWVGVYILDLILGKVLGNVIIIGFIFKAAAWIFHYFVGTIVSLLYIILSIMGIFQAAIGQYWRIPVIGVYIDRLQKTQ